MMIKHSLYYIFYFFHVFVFVNLFVILYYYRSRSEPSLQLNWWSFFLWLVYLVILIPLMTVMNTVCSMVSPLFINKNVTLTGPASSPVDMIYKGELLDCFPKNDDNFPPHIWMVCLFLFFSFLFFSFLFFSFLFFSFLFNTHCLGSFAFHKVCNYQNMTKDPPSSRLFLRLWMERECTATVSLFMNQSLKVC